MLTENERRDKITEKSSSHKWPLRQVSPDILLKAITMEEAKKFLNKDLEYGGLMHISDGDWSRLIALMMTLPIDQLRIVIYDNKNEILDRSRLPEEATFLESLRPAISLLCRLKLLTLIGLRGVWCFIVVALIVGTSCLFVYLMYLYRVRLSEANTCKNAELSRILSRLSEMLKDQLRYSESHPGTEPYLPLDRLRILLQQSYPKLHDNQLWENVNEALFCNGEDVQTGKVPRCIVARKSRFEEIPRFITFTRCFEPKLSYEAYDLTVHEYKKMRERDGAGGNQST